MTGAVYMCLGKIFLCGLTICLKWAGVKSKAVMTLFYLFRLERNKIGLELERFGCW